MTSTVPSHILQRLNGLAATFREDETAQAIARANREQELERIRQAREAERVAFRAKKFAAGPEFACVLAPSVMGQDWMAFGDVGGGYTAEACAVLRITDGLWLRYGLSPDDNGYRYGHEYLELLTAAADGTYRSTVLRSDSDVVAALEDLPQQ